jgi:hypothetical protein
MRTEHGVVALTEDHKPDKERFRIASTGNVVEWDSEETEPSRPKETVL